MNKKLMALAVAAAVSAPVLALADDSTVTLYGTLNVDFENVKAGDVFQSRNRVSSNSSNIGFRGVEPLGQGLNAWFQVESGAHIDQSVSGDTWASRNSGVGLNGNFGSILLGQWDSPYKFSTVRLDPFGDTTIGGYAAIMGGGGSPTAGNFLTGQSFVNNASFDRRVSNTVQYWSPNWSGFSFRLAYGANEEKTTTAAGSRDPRLFGLNAAYENGPLYLTGAYEEHRDFGTIASGVAIYNSIAGTTFVAPAFDQGKDTGWKFGGSYDIANLFTIAAIYEQLKWKSDTLGADVKVKDWFVAGTFHPGPHKISLTYADRGKAELNGSDITDSDARQYGVRYGFSFSKRTEFYAMYTKVDNKNNAFQDFAVNGIGLVPTTASNRGIDPQGFGAGFIHKF